MIRALMIAVLLAVASSGMARADQRWIVLNDIHFNPYDHSLRPHRGSDTNAALWRLTLAQLRSEPQPTVVVLGGDLLAHHFEAQARDNGEDPTAAALRTVRSITTDLGKTFPRAHFLIALGNNDDPCGDYRSETGGSYERQLGALLQPLVNRDGAAPDFSSEFQRGGYYTVQLPQNMGRAVVLNSVFWSFVYRGGCSGSTRNAGGKELAWLSDVLRSPQRSVLVMHIPPGFDPLSTTSTQRILAVPFLSGKENRQFLSLVQGAKDRIPFAIAGHTHRYDFRVAGGVPLLIASSISPIYHNQPAFYELNVAPDGTLRDVLPLTYDPWEESWYREVSFDKMYGVNAFTAENLQRASQRINNDDDVRRKWIAAYDVWSYRMGDIADHSWRVYWCAQTELEGGYGACAGTQKRTTGLIVAAICGLLLVVALVAFSLRRAIARR